MSDHHTERLLRERGAIADIIQMLNSSSRHQSTLDRVIMKVMEVVEPAETGLIFMWDDSVDLLRCSTAIGFNFEVFETIGLQIDEGVYGQVFSRQEPRLITSVTEIGKQFETMSSGNQEIWQKSRDGNYLPKIIYATPISSATQEYGVLGFEVFEGTAGFSGQDLSFIRDTTNLISLYAHNIRDDLNLSTINLDQMGGIFQSEWMEMISHELGMPLTAIKGYATALLLDEVDWSLDKRQEFLQLIEDECDQIEELLGDLFNFTLFNKDLAYLEPQSLYISQVANKVANEMGQRTDKHRLIIDFPPELPPIQADPRWIKQVFRNLLDNAIKYSPQGGLIVIRSELRPPNLVTHISDQGIGIPTEELILIFDKYVRGKSLDEGQVPGTGLGLPITRAIVEAHGGRIWASSTVHQGTTFSFSLPLSWASKQINGEINDSRAHPGR